MAPAEIHPPRLIGGKDLIQMGFAPGPVFKTILREVEDLQLDGAIADREQALEYVRSNYRPPRPETAV